jgi:hypothetical protein
MPNVLQSVRPYWKVDLAIEMTIHIDQTLEEIVAVGLIPLRQGRYCSGFVTAIMINWCIGVLLDLLQELLPHMAFVLVSICPEGVVLRGVSLTHEHAKQVIESPVRDALHVHKQFHRLSR